jgi:hypothetical protein
MNDKKRMLSRETRTKKARSPKMMPSLVLRTEAEDPAMRRLDLDVNGLEKEQEAATEDRTQRRRSKEKPLTARNCGKRL